MRVLVIFSDGNIGGAEINLAKLSMASNSNIEYFFSSLNNSGPLYEYFKNMKISPVCLTKSNILLFKYFCLIKYIKKNKINHLYTCGFKVSIYFRMIKFLFKNLKITNAVRCNLNKSLLKDRIVIFLEKKLSFLIDFYISNSKKALSTYVKDLKIPKNKIKLIYNGIEFKNKKDLSTLNKRKYIITVANFSKRKNHINYLNLINKFSIRTNLKFMFIGDGPEKDKIKKKICELNLKNISIIGYKKNIFKYLKESKIFVLPSTYGEGCPTSILEALSFSIPVIAFDIDGISELIINQKNGFLVKNKNYEKMYNKIKELSLDKKLYSKISNQAYLTSKKFSNLAFINLHNKHFMREIR